MCYQFKTVVVFKLNYSHSCICISKSNMEVYNIFMHATTATEAGKCLLCSICITSTGSIEEQTFLKGFLNSVTVKVIFLLWMYPVRQFLWLCFHWELFLGRARSFWMSMWYGWWRYLTKVNRRMHRDYKYYLPLRMWGVSESQCRLHTPICSSHFLNFVRETRNPFMTFSWVLRKTIIIK